MVEIDPNSGIDPEDAATNENYASIYEEDTATNFVMLTPDKVSLIPGNIYAYTVKVIDDNQLNYFKNDGVSEVCRFAYGHTEQSTQNTASSGAQNSGIISDYQNQFELIPQTHISGRLFYKLPANNGNQLSIPAPTGDISIPPQPAGVNYFNLGDLTLQNTGTANENSLATGIIYTGGHSNIATQTGPPFGRGMIHQNTESLQSTNPLANTQVRLVARLAVIEPEDNSNFPHYYLAPDGMIYGRGQAGDFTGPELIDLNGNTVADGRAYINLVLDVTETDADGNFSFDFSEDFITAACQVVQTTGNADPHTLNPGQQVISDQIDAVINPAGDYTSNMLGNNALNGQQATQTMSGHVQTSHTAKLGYICLKVEPVNEKFAVPDVDIFAMPGDVLDVGNQVAKIKTYNAEISVKSDSSIPQINSKNRPLKNVSVSILRDKDELPSEHPVIISQEGEKTDKFISNKDGEYKLVAVDTTGYDGKILIKNLVKTWDYDNDHKPYLIKLATRNEKVDQYEDVFYNYQNRFERLYPGWIPIDKYYADNINEIAGNHWYQVPTVPYEYEMTPKEPEIKGRVMASSNMENTGLKNAKIILFTQQTNQHILPFTQSPKKEEIEAQNELTASLWLQQNGFEIEKIVYTDDAGFFSITGLPVTVENETAQGPFRRIMVVKQGYKTQVINPFNFKASNLNKGELWDLKDVNMEARAGLKGEVTDENGNPVPAYVRLLESGPYEKTEDVNNRQFFELGADNYGNRIEIQALSSQYFKEIYENINVGSTRHTYKVYKKLHRLKVIVGANGINMPLANARVVVGDSIAFGNTDSQGVLRLAFASPGDQFMLNVSAGDYAPQQQILNLPVSKKDSIIHIYLTIGKSISGSITDSKTGQALPGATVFTELQNTGGHHLYLETTADAQGHYELKGIPADTQQLEVHISKQGNHPSYIGHVETVNLTHNQIFNFSLEALDAWDLTHLLGFPLQVESFKLKKNGNPTGNLAIISGYLHHLPAQTGFESETADLKLPFADLLVRKNNNGSIEPVNNTFDLNEFIVPVKINQTFTGKLKFGRNARLRMTKTHNGKGKIAGQVKLDLESFRFAYHFNGHLYLGDTKDNSNVEVFSSEAPQPQHNRYVFGLNTQRQPIPIQNYQVFGFDASADPENSYLEDRFIFLKTLLHTRIPMGNNPDLDLKLPVGKIVIGKNDLYVMPAKSGEMQFDLENWKLKVLRDPDANIKDWYFDKNLNAVYLPKVLIISKSFTATVKGMKVRPNSLREGDISISDGLQLGNIAPLELASGLHPVFNYDAGVGHYRISLIGTHGSEPAAVVKHLQECDSNLEFASVGLLSNDQNVLTISKKMRFYDILDVEVNQIMSGDGFFSLKGTPILGIPGFVPSNCIVNYRKVNGKLMPDVENLQGIVDCGNDTKYTFDNQTTAPQHIEHGLYTMYGDFTVSPSANEDGDAGDSFKLRGFLTKTNSETKIDVIKIDNTQNRYKGSNPQYLHLDDKKLRVLDGETVVTGNQWQPLHFLAKPTEDQKGMDTDNDLNFVVNGNVSLNGDNIEMDGFSDDKDSAFSSLKMAFNFKTSTLTGSMDLPDIELGYASMTQGMINMQIDPQGFYFGVTTKITYDGIPFQGGVITGYTTSDLGAISSPILYKFRAEGNDRLDLSSGIKGFYLVGQIPILDDESIDLVVVDASVDAGIGLWTFCNYDQQLSLKAGGYAYFDATAGIACFSIYQHTYLGIIADIKSDYVSVSGCGYGRFVFKACGAEVDKSYKLSIIVDSNKNIDIDLGSGTCD